MRICGVKVTHDGAVALIEGNRLRFSVEVEKLQNNKRYSSIHDGGEIEAILRSEDVDPATVDAWVVDGWGGDNADALAVQPRLTLGQAHNALSFTNAGADAPLSIAQYQEARERGIDAVLEFEGLAVGASRFRYSSTLHAAGHVFGAYCTSPFARRGESAFVLVWDGGMLPRLYYVDREKRAVESLGPIFMLVGNAYTIFSQHFGPFKVTDTFAKDNLSVAGKVMAYIALGQVRGEWLPVLERIYLKHNDGSMGFANVLAREFKAAVPEGQRRDEDVLATFHAFLERLLCEKLTKRVERHPATRRNLCMAGGCALNIKWNSAVRDSGTFAEVYVPPFPNDSGSAIGAACCAMVRATGEVALDWSVYAGPRLRPSRPAPGWSSRPCDLEALARLLHESQEPVVFLEGRAELGPRALGHRSILASAASPAMKDVLNVIKVRESYRPVSPICLEERAAEVFTPGTPDPYMLFDHDVRPEWLERIPAVVHLDGSARLQTVNDRDNPATARLVRAYAALSGVPVVCNTSANFKGTGFFPDVESATRWGRVNYVWSENTLYEQIERVDVMSSR